MAVKLLPEQGLLRQLLDYDPATGRLTWRHRSSEHFKDGFRSAEGNANLWNRRYAGVEAFTSANAKGYLTGQFSGVPYLAHRIIWKWLTGEEPAVIDHIDGNPANNRAANLRSGTQEDNSHNRRARSDSKHGTGVIWTGCKHRPWLATITVRRIQIYLGAFHTREEALAARQSAEKTHGFTIR